MEVTEVVSQFCSIHAQRSSTGGKASNTMVRIQSLLHKLNRKDQHPYLLSLVPLGSLSLVLHSWKLRTICLALDLFQDTFRAFAVSHSRFLTLFLMSACSLKSWESFLSWEHYRCQQSGCMQFAGAFHMLKTSLCVPWV